MKNYKEGLNKLKEDFETLVNSHPLKWEKVKELKKVTGVYVIYSGKDVIYVGSTNNFNVRFGVDLINKSTHTLNNKLLNEKSPEETLDFIKNKCMYKIKDCKDKVEAECLEHFAISVFEPSYNNHFYKKPGPKKV